MSTKKPNKLRSKGEPHLDKYIRPEKVRVYATYAQAAGYFSLPYYNLVTLARKANANIQVRKSVVVDMNILMDYMENELRK